MQNFLTVHCHYSKSNHGQVPQYIISGEFFSLDDIILNFLSQASAISIFHDYVYVIVFNERFNELDESGSLEYSEKLDLIFCTLLSLSFKYVRFIVLRSYH